MLDCPQDQKRIESVLVVGQGGKAAKDGGSRMMVSRYGFHKYDLRCGEQGPRSQPKIYSTAGNCE